MNDHIAIPPEALEAAARAMREEVKRSLKVEDQTAFDNLPLVMQEDYRREARAACLAMLKNWPGKLENEPNDGLLMLRAGIFLPLPQENTND